MNNLFPWAWTPYQDRHGHYRGPIAMAFLNGLNLAIFTAIVCFVAPLAWHLATALYR